MKRVLLQPAFVLHRYPYRETSFLIELFTPEYGRLTVIAKGIRKAKSLSIGLLQPFTPLLVSWVGRGELMTLAHAEAHGALQPLRSECLFAGFYLNELLISLLQKWDAHPGLYHFYKKTLLALQASTLDEKILRSFEKYLLEDLGYGPLPKSELINQTFLPDQYYRFVPEQGFVLSGIEDPSQLLTNVFLGKNLLAISQEDWQDTDILQDAKRLTRCILGPLLGSKPLYSRRLFIQPNEKKREE